MNSNDGLTKLRCSRSPLLVALTVLVILSVLLFLNGMTKPPTRDEQMYCSAGVLMAEGQTIYRDFAYVSQLPYHPLLLAALYRGLGTTHYLLTARAVSILCEIGIMACIVGIYRFAFGSQRPAGILFGTMGALFYACNPIVYMANGYAWNHDVVLLCVLLALWLTLTGDAGGRLGFIRFAAVGGLLTIASCMRITTALIWGLFLFYLFLGAGFERRHRPLVGLAFLVGTVVMLLWPLSVFIRAPQACLANIVSLPKVYAQWHTAQGSVHNKLDLTLICLTTLGYLSLLMAMLSTLVASSLPGKALSPFRHAHQRFLTALAGGFVVIALLPPTMWQQYWAVPVPFFVLSMATPLHEAWQKREQGIPARITIGIISACALLTLGAHAVTLWQSPPSLSPSEWAPVKLHRIARTIARTIAREVEVSGPLLTVSPLYALEGGRPIYPELATGAIVFRIADSLSADVFGRIRAVGPSSLGQLLRKHPPGAILVGTETGFLADIDASFSEHAPATWTVTVLESSVPDRNIRLYYEPNEG